MGGDRLTRRVVLPTTAALAACAVLAACGGDEPQVSVDGAPETIDLRSPAFDDGDDIPVAHTCDGEDRPPPLEWSGVPEETEQLALLVEDPDAPGEPFDHWVVTSIPPDASSPEPGVAGRNDFGRTGWGGPCPPEDDEPHRYEFTLVALDEPLDVAEPATSEDVRAAVDGHVLAVGRLAGRYGR